MPDFPSARRARRSALTGVAGAACAALVITGCSGDDSAANGGSSPAPTADVNTSAVTRLNGQWPLTGEQLTGELPQHPVYVVKIDNTSSSAPQVGLGQADLVVEELVEGGLTRLAVAYYSKIPPEVGPVRSMRMTDIGIVKPLHAAEVASGAAAETGAMMGRANIKRYTEGDRGFSRAPDRSSPYDLMVDLRTIAGKPHQGWKAPTTTYLPFGQAPAQGRTVSRVDAMFGGHTTSWRYSEEGWIRPDSYAEKGDEFVPRNVLLLTVKITDAGYTDPAGNPVPMSHFEGTGQGVLVSDDQAVDVTWTKKGLGGTVKLTDKQGQPVKVPAGKTWIELVPAGSGGYQVR